MRSDELAKIRARSRPAELFCGAPGSQRIIGFSANVGHRLHQFRLALAILAPIHTCEKRSTPSPITIPSGRNLAPVRGYSAAPLSVGAFSNLPSTLLAFLRPLPIASNLCIALSGHYCHALITNPSSSSVLPRHRNTSHSWSHLHSLSDCRTTEVAPLTILQLA